MGTQSIKSTITSMVCAGLLFSAFNVYAQKPSKPDAPTEDNETKILNKIITPGLERRVITEDKLDSEDWEIGIYTGVFSIEDFGSDTVIGAKLAYHVTENFFLEGSYGVTEAGETSAETLGGGIQILSGDGRDYSYYNLSIGYNLFPGEVFLGSNTAFNTTFYVIAGFGNTTFNEDDIFTYTIGGGLRFYATDWLALNATVKDHIFESDILGDSKVTNNLEATLGLSLYF